MAEQKSPAQLDAEAAAKAAASTSNEDRAATRAGARAVDDVDHMSVAKNLATDDERAAFERGELGDVFEPAKPVKWKSDPNAQKMNFLVKCRIKGEVQGRKLALGKVAELEVTRDIRDMIRPGCLEPIGELGTT